MKSLGKFVLFLGQIFVRLETFKTYAKRTVDESIKIGYNSVFIVAIVAAFMGAVTTLQTAYNLLRNGMTIYR